MRVLGLGAIVALALVATSVGAAEQGDLVVSLGPPAAGIGRNAGTFRLSLGEVRDEGFAEAKDSIGMGLSGTYVVRMERSRVDAVRRGIEEALRSAGLLAEGSSPVSVDVVIRRIRFDALTTFAKLRLRGECFLEFTFRQEGSPIGRVLACGTAEIPAQVAGRPKVEEACRVAFADALSKLAHSATLGRVAGTGWSPAAEAPPSKGHRATRIAKDEFYGPSGVARARATVMAAAFASRAPIRTAYLPDWDIVELKAGQDPLIDAALARRYLPELAREHLQAFYPGAFEGVVRSAPTSGAAGVLVAGRLDTFKVGSFAKQVWIGMGAGKDKLDGSCSFRDAATGAEIHAFEVQTAAWGGAWQAKRGQVRDMAQQLAQDVAYLLVRSCAPDYRPPADLEISFDGTSFPQESDKVLPGALR